MPYVEEHIVAKAAILRSFFLSAGDGGGGSLLLFVIDSYQSPRKCLHFSWCVMTYMIARVSDAMRGRLRLALPSIRTGTGGRAEAIDQATNPSLNALD